MQGGGLGVKSRARLSILAGFAVLSYDRDAPNEPFPSGIWTVP